MVALGVLLQTQKGNQIIVKDVIADAMLQQIITRPAEYSVLATMNLNGDYISDALAAQVGGIGIAPGANINYDTGIAIFEATHGTAPKYAGQDKVNPGSVILSAEMMLRHMGWSDAADLIVSGMEGAISAKTVTYDFERQWTTLNCSSVASLATQLFPHVSTMKKISESEREDIISRAKSAVNDEPIEWFDQLYGMANRDPAIIPWARMA